MKSECLVRGLISKGAMCGHVIVGGRECGYSGDCEHKRAEALAAPATAPDDVVQRLMELVDAYREQPDHDEEWRINPCLVPSRRGLEEALRAALAAPATAPDPLHPQYIAGFKSGAYAARRRMELNPETAPRVEIKGNAFAPVPVTAPATAPERKPMTKGQREQVARRAEAAMNGNVNLSWRDALISETEAFHDIKETP